MQRVDTTLVECVDPLPHGVPDTSDDLGNLRGTPQFVHERDGVNSFLHPPVSLAPVQVPQFVGRWRRTSDLDSFHDGEHDPDEFNRFAYQSSWAEKGFNVRQANTLSILGGNTPMTQKVAIHYSGSFAKIWRNYCKRKNIPFKNVDCLSSRILSQLDDCSALLWHHHHMNYSQSIMVKEFLFSLEYNAKIKIFPNFSTGWHFDDKISQFFLFKQIKAPTPNTWVFFKKEEALKALTELRYPVVMKLRKGAGSANVVLIRSKTKAKRMVERMFSTGISPTPGKFNNVFKTILSVFNIKHLRSRKNSNKSKERERDKIGLKKEGWKEKILTYIKYLISSDLPREKNYIYFQDFIPNCDGDYRVIVIDKFAYAFKRLVRKNDFRASGSGIFFLDPQLITKDLLTMAFKISRTLRTQCIAFDFLKTPQGHYVLIEMSYGFRPWQWDYYWDSELNLILNKPIHPVELMIENLLRLIDRR